MVLLLLLFGVCENRAPLSLRPSGSCRPFWILLFPDSPPCLQLCSLSVPSPHRGQGKLCKTWTCSHRPFPPPPLLPAKPSRDSPRPEFLVATLQAPWDLRPTPPSPASHVHTQLQQTPCFVLCLPMNFLRLRPTFFHPSPGLLICKMGTVPLPHSISPGS